MEVLNFRSKHQYQASTLGIELPITISLVGKQISLVAKVDTGAASCIFKREYAEGLGIDVERGMLRSFSTVTGRFPAYGHSVKLSCLDCEFDSLVYFTGQYDFPRNVLGLEGWLDQLRFGLVHYDQPVFLSHYDD